jgi:hypothetical protein
MRSADRHRTTNNHVVGEGSTCNPRLVVLPHTQTLQSLGCHPEVKDTHDNPESRSPCCIPQTGRQLARFHQRITSGELIKAQRRCSTQRKRAAHPPSHMTLNSFSLLYRRERKRNVPHPSCGYHLTIERGFECESHPSFQYGQFLLRILCSFRTWWGLVAE